MNIRFYKNKEIDRATWDRYIHEAHNGLIYATAEFLDAMAEGWCALMDEDSGSVWPLLMKKKWGITYSFQPPFAQQLGIFSRNELTDEMFLGFTVKAREYFDLIDVYMNYQNPLPGSKERTNFILDLSDGFKNISQQFRKDLVTKPMAAGLQYTEGTVEETFDFYRQYIFPQNKHLTNRQLTRFKKLATGFLSQSKALVRRVADPGGETLSVGLLFIDHRRLYYMIGANSPKAKRLSANAYLLYEVIREFAERNLIFDFEGSEIPGVKAFFEKYAPVRQPYYHLIIENLNPVQKTLKDVSEKLRGKK